MTIKVCLDGVGCLRLECARIGCFMLDDQGAVYKCVRSWREADVLALLGYCCVDRNGKTLGPCRSKE